MLLTAHSHGLTWTKQQSMTLIVVAALHTGLVWMLWKKQISQSMEAVGWTRPASQPPTMMETLLLLLPAEPSKAAPSAKQPKQIQAPAPQHISSVGKQAVAENRAKPLSAAELPQEKAANPVDWQAVAAATIRQAAQTATTPSKVREFGQSIRQQAPTTTEPPSAFAPSAHRFGDTTKTTDGDNIVWLSKNCYQVANSDAEHFKAFATGMPDMGKGSVTCKKSIGQSQDKAHLFEHLKHPPASEP